MQIQFRQFHGRYGSPKLTVELREMGFAVSRKRVAKLMRMAGLRSIIHRKYRPRTTDSQHRLPVCPNLLNREFSADAPARRWVSDLTYIPTGNGWTYLTTIMDLFDRKIVGWALSTDMETENTVIPAWERAIRNRPIAKGKPLFHSDRGGQYASRDFRKAIGTKNVRQSMSRKGNCWDNAPAESFFKIIKSEMVNHLHFHNKSQAELAIFEFIEIWYNRQRRHAALGYQSPINFFIIKLKETA